MIMDVIRRSTDEATALQYDRMFDIIMHPHDLIQVKSSYEPTCERSICIASTYYIDQSRSKSFQ